MIVGPKLPVWPTFTGYEPVLTDCIFLNYFLTYILDESSKWLFIEKNRLDSNFLTEVC